MRDTTAVVVPIKSFLTAKARLAEVLTLEARAALARHCAQAVVHAAHPLTVFVVCDDPEVSAWASANGARVVTAERPGLNEAAVAGREAARLAGFARALTVHSDLPKAESLESLAHEEAQAVIVPDRHRDGTNALLLPTTGPFDFHYGPGSFAAHCQEAADRGLSTRVIERPDLALDLDTLDDLREAGIATQK